ncbi:TPA: helix-turn-helix transcriptional regulator [Streptococcus pyogenes]|nr:helix-turn-helix transcriptional regulator [Streptococcus pyogenes]
MENRLQKIRKEQTNLNQKDFFYQVVNKKLNLDISFRTYQNWENPKNTIKPDKAQILADYFGVWLPYLLGNSNIRTEEQANFLAEMNKRINSEGDSFSFDMTATESDEHDLLYNYRQLETPYKNQVRKFTRDMWELQKESKNFSPKSP